MSDSAGTGGQSVLKKFSYETGKLCRVASRQVKLSSIRRQRKHYFQNLGERLYIFKVLQKEEDVWDKEEISQLLLTLSDLDQEQELLLQEINEIKAEEMPADEAEKGMDAFSAPEAAPATADKAASGDKKPAAKTTAKPAAKAAADKPARKRTTAGRPRAKSAASTTKSTAKTGTTRTARKKPAAKKTTAKKPAAKTTAGGSAAKNAAGESTEKK